MRDTKNALWTVKYMTEASVEPITGESVSVWGVGWGLQHILAQHMWWVVYIHIRCWHTQTMQQQCRVHSQNTPPTHLHAHPVLHFQNTLDNLPPTHPLPSLSPGVMLRSTFASTPGPTNAKLPIHKSTYNTLQEHRAIVNTWDTRCDVRGCRSHMIG